MKFNRIWIASAGAALLLAAPAWGLNDSPSGQPPYGLDFGDSASGQQYDGVVTLVFRDYEEPFSPRFDAVTRLRKGNEYHAFYTEYDCAVADPCSLCFDPDPGSGTGGVEDLRMDIGNAIAIQLCLQDAIEPEVMSDFGLTGVDIRLKDVGAFVSETDPPGGVSGRRIVAADIEVTAK